MSDEEEKFQKLFHASPHPIIVSTIKDNPVRDDTGQIHQVGLRAASLTSQLLAFSRKQNIQARFTW